METVLNSMFYDNPEDVYGHLSNYFEKFAKTPLITKLKSSTALDSRGQSTVQTSVYCNIKNHQQCVSTVVSPSPVSHVLENAKIEEREAEETERKEDIQACLDLIQTELNNKLNGLDPCQQTDIDTLIYDFIAEKKRESDILKEEQKKESPEEEAQSPVVQSPSNKKNKPASPKKGKAASLVIVVPDEPREIFIPGTSAVCAISKAVCCGAARVQQVPLYQHIASLSPQQKQKTLSLPLPMVTILQAGRAATGKLKCIKEFMVIPKPGMPMKQAVEHIQGIYHHISKNLYVKGGVAAKFVNDIGALCPVLEKVEQGLDLVQEAITSLGLTPGEDFHIALNIAAHEMFDMEKGKYEVILGQLKSPDDMVDFWGDIISRYPSVIAIIDPLRKQEGPQWMKLCDRISTQCYILGDHVYHRPGLLKSEEITEYFKTSGVVYKLEHMNTITDLITCVQKMEECKNITVLTTSQGDTTDSFITDLSVGIGAKFLKLGAPCRGERIIKFNRLLQIEEELQDGGRLGCQGDHAFPKIDLPPPPVGEEENQATETPSPRKDSKKK
ncbi:hypothetical protein SNE40_007799 [Patella caerulea]